MLEGSTAPHCKQVLVTGEFCAADAHTPARVYEKRIARLPRVENDVFRPNVTKKLSLGSELLKKAGQRQASICWASMSRLKAIRRSRATAAK